MSEKTVAILPGTDTGLASISTHMFLNAEPSFIDFGCGRGGSTKYGQSLLRGSGIGIDISAERVAECRQAGLDVCQGNILTFDARSIAPVAIAFDLIPELDGLAAFETACRNMLRAARDYVLIQHLNFDSAEILLGRGAIVPEHARKNVRFRPRVIDYIHFVRKYGPSLNIVGFAIFGMGEVNSEPMSPGQFSGIMSTPDDGQPVYRSIRVILARRSPARLKSAIARAGNGAALLVWEAPAEMEEQPAS